MVQTAAVPDVGSVLTDPTQIRDISLRQVQTAQDFVGALGAASTALVPPTISATFPTGGSAPAIATSEPPSLEDVAWVAPGLPSPFVADLDVDGFMPAPFDDAPPELAFGTAPDEFTDTIGASPTVNTDFDYPELDLTLPSAPTLLSLDVTTFDGLNLPTFDDEEVPELTVVAPTLREYTPGEFYSSALLTALKDELTDRIVNGGTGLNPDVENAIWDRGREREARQASDALMDLDRMEGMGFSMPPGVYLDARLKIQTEMGYNAANISREIMIKQAEMEMENVVRALDTATTVEGRLIDYTNNIEQRLFESARYATEAGIAIYNAQVQAYAAYLDAYKTKINIYEARIRAELARVDVYKTQIEAERVKVDINTALVNQYRVEADVALSAVEVYKAEISAIQTRAEIERLRVQIFGEEVRAYATRVQAYTAGVEGFRARIGAETARQDAYRSQVQAYAATVDAGAKQIDARIAAYRGQIDAKALEWEGYKAVAESESQRVRAVAASNQSIAAMYSATVSGESSYNETLTKQWQAALEQAQRVAEIGVSAAKANAELYMTTRSLALDAAKVGAQVSSQIAASALSAVSYSQSYSLAGSQSVIGSISENYSFSESASV